MTTFKKINSYIVMLSMFQLTNCADKQTDDSEKYPQRSTEYLEYEAIEDTKPAPESVQPHGPKVVSDTKFNNYTSFGFGLERKKVSAEVENGKIIIKTETWTRKKLDDSWLPAKIAGIGTLAALGIVAYSQSDYLHTAFKNYLSFGDQNQNKKDEQLAISGTAQLIIDGFGGQNLNELVDQTDLTDQNNIDKLYKEIQSKLPGQYKFSKGQFQDLCTIIRWSEKGNFDQYFNENLLRSNIECNIELRFKKRHIQYFLEKIYPEMLKVDQNKPSLYPTWLAKTKELFREAGFIISDK